MMPDDPHDPTPALETLLRWYVDMGVDASLDAEPHDRFAAPVPAPPRENAPVSTRSPPRAVEGSALPAASEDLIRQAAEMAVGAADLADLLARWRAVPGCALGKAARFIEAGGSAGAPLMLLGATPEEDDERAGAAFAGAQGKLLDAMLRAIGLERGGVMLAHVVPWRPPGGRAPTPLELALNVPFARRLITLSSPKLLLCLGERAAQPLLETRDSLTRLRGRWFDIVGDATSVKMLVTFSPSYLLRQPLQKRLAWADLQLLGAALDRS